MQCCVGVWAKREDVWHGQCDLLPPHPHPRTHDAVTHAHIHTIFGQRLTINRTYNDTRHTHTHTHTHAHAHPPRGKVFRGGGGRENESLAAYASISSNRTATSTPAPTTGTLTYTGLDHLSARNLKPHHENCKLSMKKCGNKTHSVWWLRQDGLFATLGVSKRYGAPPWSPRMSSGSTHPLLPLAITLSLCI